MPTSFATCSTILSRTTTASTDYQRVGEGAQPRKRLALSLTEEPLPNQRAAAWRAFEVAGARGITSAGAISVDAGQPPKCLRLVLDEGPHIVLVDVGHGVGLEWQGEAFWEVDRQHDNVRVSVTAGGTLGDQSTATLTYTNQSC